MRYLARRSTFFTANASWGTGKSLARRLLFRTGDLSITALGPPSSSKWTAYATVVSAAAAAGSIDLSDGGIAATNAKMSVGSSDYEDLTSYFGPWTDC